MRKRWVGMVSLFWWALFLTCVRHMHYDGKQIKTCSARREITLVHGKWEVKVIFRNLKMANHYAKEELIEMLSLVRQEEFYAGWRIPEPKNPLL